MAPAPKIAKTRSWKKCQKRILRKNRQKLLRPKAEKWRPRQKTLRQEAEKWRKKKKKRSFLKKLSDSLWRNFFFFWEIVWDTFGPNWVWPKESFPTFISFQKKSFFYIYKYLLKEVKSRWIRIKLRLMERIISYTKTIGIITIQGKRPGVLIVP